MMQGPGGERAGVAGLVKVGAASKRGRKKRKNRRRDDDTDGFFHDAAAVLASSGSLRIILLVRHRCSLVVASTRALRRRTLPAFSSRSLFLPISSLQLPSALCTSPSTDILFNSSTLRRCSPVRRISLNSRSHPTTPLRLDISSFRPLSRFTSSVSRLPLLSLLARFLPRLLAYFLRPLPVLPPSSPHRAFAQIRSKLSSTQLRRFDEKPLTDTARSSSTQPARKLCQSGG